MTLPKRLLEKRDELALGRAENVWGERDSLEQEEQNSFDDIVKDYKSGWNDCAALLLPEIKKLKATLLIINRAAQTLIPDFDEDDAFPVGLDPVVVHDSINVTLQSLHEFLGEKSEGE